MHQLALYFLLLAPVAAAAPAGGVAGLVDPCATARRIAEQPPCLRAEDCGAYRQWAETFGEPGARPLDPQRTATVAAAVRPNAVRPNAFAWCPAGPAAGPAVRLGRR
jgi:hypothetical protein